MNKSISKLLSTYLHKIIIRKLKLHLFANVLKITTFAVRKIIRLGNKRGVQRESRLPV